MTQLIDLTGQRFGKLTVLERGPNKGNAVGWWCLCDCGNEERKLIAGRSLKSGHTTTCGCLYRQPKLWKRVENPVDDHPEYSSWKGMKQRCNNPNNKRYKYYGAEGKKVCDRWINSYRDFLEDMGPKPGPEYSVDRIDNNGHYEPGNCRWGTDEIQRRNTRNNYFVEYHGQTKCLIEWAEYLNMDYSALRWRLQKGGWDLEKAFTTPVKKKKR